METLQFAITKSGNKIELIGQDGADNILVIGVFHGDETQGKYLIEKYLNEISPSPYPSFQRDNVNNILFIPCLNPDGMKECKRTNANGVDLNRNFPTKNWGQDTSQAGANPLDYYGGESAGSEIETKFLINVIEEYKPKAILTLHAPYKIVNYDGPADDLAQKISNIINYPTQKSIGYPTPGSFGTYCGVERNIPTITLELDDKISVDKLENPIFKIFDMLKSY